MAINPNNGVLDIINGTLKVSSIDIKQAGGFSTAINTVARNNVLLFDDQKSTTTFMPTAQGGYMSSTGVTRDTTAGYLELGTSSDEGWVYWPLQLPNSWHTEFDMHVTATGGVLTFSLFNTSEPNHTDFTNNDGGYKIVFDNTNNQIVIYWEGSVHKTVSIDLRSNDWQHVNVNYSQGATSVSLAGKVVLTHEFTQNYQEFDSRYVGFSATAGTSHKIRHLRIHNGDKWLYTKTSNASDITYVSGNVGIGSLAPTELLDVHGNVHIAKDLTVDGNLRVSGTTTFIDSTNLVVEDPIIELAKGNTSDTIDAGLIVTRGASNVAIAFRGDEEELAFGYTQSGASGTDVTPIANGGLDVRVYGNLFANNLTTTANVDASYINGNVVTSNLMVSGEYTMGGRIIPDTNDAYDIGSAEKKIRDLYVADNSLWIGDETKISFTGGKMRFRKRKKNVVPAAILAAGGTASGAKTFSGKSNLSNIKSHEWLKYMRTLSGKGNSIMGNVFRDDDDDYEATTAAEAWKDINDDIYSESNVSIGKTSSPTVTLDVEGDGKFSGNVVTMENIGISTATPSANLHVMGYQYVNGPPTLANSFDHSDAPLTLTHGTATSSTAINDPKPLLHLTRSGTNNESYGARASFNLSRYENSSTHSRSRLDVALADGTYAESTVMTLRSDGKVGVGVTSPAYKLDVDGDLNLSTGSTLRINGTPAVFSNWTVSGSDIYRPSSNVGIGVSNPAHKLDVDGDINIASGSNLKIGGTNAVFSNWTVNGSDIYRPSGNVGIGVSNPDSELHVHDANNPNSGMVLSSTTGYHRIYESSGQLYIQSGVAASADSRADINFTSMYASTNYMKILGSNGNVGIGTASPTEILHLAASANPQILVEDTGSANRAEIRFKTATTDWCLGQHGGDTGKFKIANNTDVGTGTLVTIEQSGDVGIGTATPTGKLHVTGGTTTGSSTDIYIGDSADADKSSIIRYIKGDASSNPGRLIFGNWGDNFNTTGGSTMCIKKGGNVGIGTNDPGTKLHLYQSAGSANLVEKHTNKSTGDYNQHINYTHYASVAEGATRDPDNARGLWVGNMVDENDGSPSGANFMAFTNSFTFYGVDDQTKWDSGLSFTSNTDDLLYSGGTFNKCVRITADGNVGIGDTTPSYKLDVNGDINVSSGSAIRINGTALANSATIEASVTAGNNTLVQRHSSGYIFANYFNTSPDDVTSGVTKVCVETGNDGYIRHGTSAAISSFLGLANSATIEATTADTANKIAQRNGSGDIHARLFRSDYQNQSTISGGIAYRVSTTDNYIRFCTDMGAVRSKIGCAAVAGSTGQNFSSKECYVQNWVRTKGNAGHYWESSSNGNGWHIYPRDRADMNLRTGSGNGGICGTIGNGTARGYVHWTTSNEIGFLTNSRSWSLRMDSNKKCHIYGNLEVDGHIYGGNTVFVGNSSSRGLRGVSGNYGTVQTTGGGAGGWEGYSIDGRYVFMSADNNSCGIYNDIDNEWMIYCYRNSYVQLRHNGSNKFETTSDGTKTHGWSEVTGYKARTDYDFWKAQLWTTGFYNNDDNYSSFNIGVYANYWVRGDGLLASSDERVKTDIQTLDTGIALSKLEKIRPVSYKMKNTGEFMFGFIGQEIEKELPNVVNLDSGTITDFNIFGVFSNKQETKYQAEDEEKDVFVYTLTLDEPLPSTFDVDKAIYIEAETTGDTIQFFYDPEYCGKPEIGGTVMKLLSETDNVKESVRYKIIGTRVHDFRSLDYNEIFTVTTAALKEVNEQLKAEKIKTASLETQLASVLARLDALEASN